MPDLIKYVEKESLSNFVKNAKKILDEKKQQALEIEKLGFSIVNESDDYDEDDDEDYEIEDDDDDEDYEKSEPNYDVDIDPSEFDENDLTDLEKAIWGDEDDDELYENVEHLKELSKKTLTLYINKANKDYTKHSENQIEYEKNENKKSSQKAERKMANREDGMLRAGKKVSKINKSLTKENLELTSDQLAYAIENFEHLDELSKKTLASYIKKASIRNVSSGMGLHHSQSSDTQKRSEKSITKRIKGITKAADKLAKG